MTATVTDSKRRLTMPKELPPQSPVTIEQVDQDTWMIKRRRPDREMIFVAFPRVDQLPDDPAWEAVERRIVAHNNRKLPPFEE